MEYMENYLDKTYELRYFEMNNFGLASPTTILTLLEETAAEHCYNIGYSLYTLEKQNIGWVLVAGAIDMMRYPKYKEKIIIRTWMSKFTLVKGYRENIIFDSTGNIIGRAKGMWVFYDIKKRKPVPVIDDIKQKWGLMPGVSQEIHEDAIKIISHVNYQQEFAVYKSDVDSNKHVNNIRYFHWLIESLPDTVVDNYVLKSIHGKFFSDAKYEEKIRIYIESETEQRFLHTMKSNVDNRVLAAAHTVWEKA
jgi:acyl-ACP thioesterase